jgi:hypothetical protein
MGEDSNTYPQSGAADDIAMYPHGGEAKDDAAYCHCNTAKDKAGYHCGGAANKDATIPNICVIL